MVAKEENYVFVCLKNVVIFQFIEFPVGGVGGAVKPQSNGNVPSGADVCVCVCVCQSATVYTSPLRYVQLFTH